MKSRKPRTLIIGLCQIGHHNAEYLKQLGLHVEGHDPKSNTLRRALNANVIQSARYYGIKLWEEEVSDTFAPRICSTIKSNH